MISVLQPNFTTSNGEDVEKLRETTEKLGLVFNKDGILIAVSLAALDIFPPSLIKQIYDLTKEYKRPHRER